jgi:hypothetical protein
VNPPPRPAALCQRGLAATLLLATTLMLQACVSQLDPMLGHAVATLPGSEFGPPAALVADLERAEASAGKLAANLERAAPNTVAAPVAQAGPAAVLRLRVVAGDIVQRLTAMEEVRRRSNYVAQVQAQQRLTDEMRDARERAVFLQRRVNWEVAWGQSMANLARGTVREVRDGTHTDGSPRYARYVDTGLGNRNPEGIRRAEAALGEGQAEAERLRREMSLPGLERFEQAKAFIATRSSSISDRLWPELRRAMAEVDRLSAGASAPP